VLEPTNPIPELAGGPASGLSAAAQLKLLPPGTFDRLLPLPPFRYAADTDVAHVEPSDAQRYVRQLFFPLTHTDVLGDASALIGGLTAALSPPGSSAQGR
jgi:hypothetical protein